LCTTVAMDHLPHIEDGGQTAAPNGLTATRSAAMHTRSLLPRWSRSSSLSYRQRAMTCTQGCRTVRTQIMSARRTTSTLRCSIFCWRRMVSTQRRQVETFNLLLHDDVKATKIVRSIGPTAKQGCCPGGVEINLPEGGVVEGSEILRGSKPNMMSCRKNRLHIIVGCIALCISDIIYRLQEFWEVRHIWIHMVIYNT
jgi:hypothetical protein